MHIHIGYAAQIQAQIIRRSNVRVRPRYLAGKDTVGNRHLSQFDGRPPLGIIRNIPMPAHARLDVQRTCNQAAQQDMIWFQLNFFIHRE